MSEMQILNPSNESLLASIARLECLIRDLKHYGADPGEIRGHVQELLRFKDWVEERGLKLNPATRKYELPLVAPVDKAHEARIEELAKLDELPRRIVLQDSVVRGLYVGSDKRKKEEQILHDLNEALHEQTCKYKPPKEKYVGPVPPDVPLKLSQVEGGPTGNRVFGIPPHPGCVHKLWGGVISRDQYEKVQDDCRAYYKVADRNALLVGQMLDVVRGLSIQEWYMSDPNMNNALKFFTDIRRIFEAQGLDVSPYPPATPLPEPCICENEGRIYNQMCLESSYPNKTSTFLKILNSHGSTMISCAVAHCPKCGEKLPRTLSTVASKDVPSLTAPVKA
jgi:hypothetical protein